MIRPSTLPLLALSTLVAPVLASADTNSAALARSVAPSEMSAPASEAAADEEAACPGPVTIQRAHSDEMAELQLVACDGSPQLASLTELSLLGRPTGTPRPSAEALAVFEAHAPEARRARFVSPGVHRLDPGLLVRLQALATEFVGKPLAIVSGYRPHARRGSRHRVGKALDVQVAGVPRRQVALFARSIPKTGVGYYPNSTFTHIDVREASHHWVDRSRPGEAPAYIAWGDGTEESADPPPETGTRDEPAEVSVAELVVAEVPTEESEAPEAPAAVRHVASAALAGVSAPASTVAPAEAPSTTPAASASPTLPRAERAPELDDTGRVVDLAATSAAARDAIQAHRDAAPFTRAALASDHEVDWSLPWW